MDRPIKSDILHKTFWSLAPLIWGLFTWFFAFGYGNALFSYLSISFAYQIGILFRVLLGMGFIFYFFRTNYQKNAKKIKLVLFNTHIPFFNWKVISISTIAITLFSFFFTPLWEYPSIQHLVLGVFISSCLEELYSRSLFVAFKFTWNGFFFYSLINAIAFSLMHLGYQQSFLWHDLIFKIANHSTFSIVMAFIALKSKRIELPIMVHLLFNFLGMLNIPSLIHGVLEQGLLIFGIFISLKFKKEDSNQVFQKR